MTSSEEHVSAAMTPRPVSFPGLTVGASMAAITLTYFVANSAVDLSLKTAAFLAIVLLFVTLSGMVYRRDLLSARRVSHERDLNMLLNGLDEAKDYFAGSLDSSDTFRLIVSRVRSILPVSSAVLWTLSGNGSSLACSESFNLDILPHSDLGLRCKNSRAVVTGLEMGSPTGALPLFRDHEVGAVLQLFFENGFVLNEAVTEILDAAAVRIAPLILSSLAFDRSRDNALTDSATGLPNERAFYLVLENQIAEASRKAGERPLTILAMDVQGFDDINRRYGHSTGDAVLGHVSATIRDTMRHMDLFARSANDEFLAILATASGEVSSEVIERIRSDVERRFKLDDSHSLEIEIDFGWAEFGVDGETAQDLVKSARARKGHAKFPETGKVIRFSQQL